MLRKGLPRAFPGLYEVKEKSRKEGTQYRSRVFEAPQSLMNGKVYNSTIFTFLPFSILKFGKHCIHTLYTMLCCWQCVIVSPSAFCGILSACVAFIGMLNLIARKMI